MLESSTTAASEILLIAEMRLAALGSASTRLDAVRVAALRLTLVVDVVLRRVTTSLDTCTT